MKTSRLTYPLIALAIVPVALVSLKKINKVSFFDHFFKVIEEVELRNSHEVDAFPVHLWYDENSPSTEKTTSYTSPIQLFAAFGPEEILVGIGFFGGMIWEKAHSGSDVYHLFSPLRAP